MTTPRLRTLFATLSLALPAAAQITYVDADPDLNTSLADGSPFVPTSSTSGTDGLWAERGTAASNGGTVFEANGGSAPGEDCPMLRVTVDGLVPGVRYRTFAYFWGVGHQRWRGRAATASSQPMPPLPGYNTNHFNGSAYAPMQALAATSFLGFQQQSLGLRRNTDEIETDGHFLGDVKLTDGTGYLFEVPLGEAVADPQGRMFVYVDDVENQTFNDRTWFDGVGYSLAPATFGTDCGSPAPQIAVSGSPEVGNVFSVDVTGAPSAAAALVFGLSDREWTGQPLPFDLGALGLGAGCALNVAPHLTAAVATDAAGQAGVGLLVPPLAVPAPPLHFQWILQAGSGVSVSKGLTVFGDVPGTTFRPVGRGWSRNSVNAGIFRYNSVVSHHGEQFVAYYDELSRVVLAKRAHGSDDWQVVVTPYTGNTADAHNSISIMVDGAGYLHMAWNHHNNGLNYCRSVAPGSLLLGAREAMVGSLESRVTYPEFKRMADGSLVFFYRDGSSGNGNVVLNAYDLTTRQWRRLHSNLISGQGQRNAYWQTCTDTQGSIHVSWVWRESSDAATNHDICYAVSRDGGVTWEQTGGQRYTLPIVASTAEYAALVPQRSSLINQTSMSADGQGNPYVVTYWTRPGGVTPDYHIVWHDGTRWSTSRITDRKKPYFLGGGGSLAFPLSRPQVLVETVGNVSRAVILFRDEERGSKVSAAVSDDLATGVWRIRDLTGFTIDKWEPSYDTERWRTSRELHVYVQRVGQGPNETLTNTPPQTVGVLEWRPW